MKKIQWSHLSIKLCPDVCLCVCVHVFFYRAQNCHNQAYCDKRNGQVPVLYWGLDDTKWRLNCSRSLRETLGRHIAAANWTLGQIGEAGWGEKKNDYACRPRTSRWHDRRTKSHRFKKWVFFHLFLLHNVRVHAKRFRSSLETAIKQRAQCRQITETRWRPKLCVTLTAHKQNWAEK